MDWNIIILTYAIAVTVSIPFVVWFSMRLGTKMAMKQIDKILREVYGKHP